MTFQRAELDEPHPAPDTPLDALRGLALGVVAGLRGAMPLALLARQIAREGPDIADGGWVLDLLARRSTGIVLGLGALGEIIGDKRPTAPSRLMPIALAGRVISGGTAGAVHSLAEGRRSDRGALFGVIGAIVGSLAGYWLRTRLSRIFPALLVALAEDALSVALGVWAVAR